MKTDDGDDKEVFLNRYLIGSVFDVSQTEGKPVPMCPVSRLARDDNGMINKIVDILGRNGWTVEFKRDLLVAASGMTYLKEKRIFIDKTMSPAQQAKTLLHEWAHAYLHADKKITRENYTQGELEAGSVAYIVGRIHA